MNLLLISIIGLSLAVVEVSARIRSGRQAIQKRSPRRSQAALDKFCDCLQHDRDCFDRVMNNFKSIVDIGKRMEEITGKLAAPENRGGNGGGNGGGGDGSWGGFDSKDTDWDNEWDTNWDKRALSSEGTCKAKDWFTNQIIPDLGDAKAEKTRGRKKRDFGSLLGGLLGGLGGGGGGIAPVINIIDQITKEGGGDGIGGIIDKFGGKGSQEMISCDQAKQLMQYMGYMSEEMDTLTVKVFNMNNPNDEIH